MKTFEEKIKTIIEEIELKKSQQKAEIEERKKKQKEELQRLQDRLRKLQTAESKKLRKQRNHRLIQVGALVEKYSCEITNLESFEKYLKQYGYYIKKNQSE